MRQGIPDSEWFRDPENVARYRKWRDLPDTQMFINFVINEMRPQLLPSDGNGRPCIELTGYIHGQNVGEHRSLRRLMTLDLLENIPEDLAAHYGAIQWLMDARGCTEDEARRILKESEENG